MSGGAYAGRLALLILIFVVVIPGAVVGLLYAAEHSPGMRSTALGFGYVAYFIGIPLWIVGFAIATWRATRARARTVGLPGWVAPSLIVLVAADWRLFLWMFRPLFAPFLCGAAALLIALMLWPDDAGGRGGRGQRAAIWVWAAFVLLAGVSLAASLLWSVTTMTPIFLIDAYARQLAFWCAFVVAVVLLWAVVEARGRLQT